jgi:hypothetical protein
VSGVRKRDYELRQNKMKRYTLITQKDTNGENTEDFYSLTHLKDAMRKLKPSEYPIDIMVFEGEIEAGIFDGDYFGTMDYKTYKYKNY